MREERENERMEREEERRDSEKENNKETDERLQRNGPSQKEIDVRDEADI